MNWSPPWPHAGAPGRSAGPPGPPGPLAPGPPQAQCSSSSIIMASCHRAVAPGRSHSNHHRVSAAGFLRVTGRRGSPSHGDRRAAAVIIIVNVCRQSLRRLGLRPPGPARVGAWPPLWKFPSRRVFCDSFCGLSEAAAAAWQRTAVPTAVLCRASPSHDRLGLVTRDSDRDSRVLSTVTVTY